MTYIEPIHYQDIISQPVTTVSGDSEKIRSDETDTSQVVHHPSDELQPDEQFKQDNPGWPVATRQENDFTSSSLQARHANLAFRDKDSESSQFNDHLIRDTASSFTPRPTSLTVGRDNRGFVEVLQEMKGTALISSFITPVSSKSSMSSFFQAHSELAANATAKSGVPDINNSNRSSALSTDLEKQREAEQKWKPGKQVWLVMLTLAVSSLTVALDATILVTVLPALAKELHGSATEAFWAGTSYLLTSAVVQPFIASLSDIFGRRELLVTSITLFLLGSIVCAVARSFDTLLGGRVVQGIGGGGIITLAQLIYGDIVPLRQRPRYFALVLGTWALGTMFGPLIGGAFVDKATWRWCFYLNLPTCGIALPMSFFLVKLQTERVSLASKLRMVDWTGGILFIASLTAFLIGLTLAGVQYDWNTYHVLAPLIIGATGIVLTTIYESRLATNPFLVHSPLPQPQRLRDLHIRLLPRPDPLHSTLLPFLLFPRSQTPFTHQHGYRPIPRHIPRPTWLHRRLRPHDAHGNVSLGSLERLGHRCYRQRSFYSVGRAYLQSGVGNITLYLRPGYWHDVDESQLRCASQREGDER